MKVLHDWNDDTYTIDIMRHAAKAPGGFPILVCVASLGDPEIRPLTNKDGRSEVTFHDVASENDAAGRVRRMIESGALA